MLCLGVRILLSLEPQDTALVVYKTICGTLTATGLDHALHNVGIAPLASDGVVTNVCIRTSARDAANLGYGVVAVDDACAAHSPKMHAASLLTFQCACGRMRTTDDIVALIEQAATDAA